MGEVIQGKFLPDDNSGYLIDGDKVTGVYMGDLAANTEVGGHEVCVFDKSTDTVTAILDVEEMNRFCLMWLCIFDPDVIKEDV